MASLRFLAEMSFYEVQRVIFWICDARDRKEVSDFDVGSLELIESS